MKKLLMLIFVVSMMSILTCTVSASGMGGYEAVFSDTGNFSTTAEAGDTLVVKATFENQYYAAIKSSIEFDDSVFELTKITFNTKIPGYVTKPQDYSNPVSINWLIGDKSNQKWSGDFATFTFKVKNNVPDGEYRIQFAYYPFNTVVFTNSGLDIDGYDWGFPSMPDLRVQIGTPAEDISLDEHRITLDEGETTRLYATLEPEDATYEVVWESSDETVVTVSQSGKLTAVGGGYATVTATAGNVVTDSCRVTVNAKHICEYTEIIVDDQYLVSAATCMERTLYHYSCECGKEGTETFYYDAYGEHVYVDESEYVSSVASVYTLRNSISGTGKICKVCGLRESTGVNGYAVTGTVTSSDNNTTSTSNDTITIELANADNVYTITVTSSGINKTVGYNIENVLPGTYTMTVSKSNHVEREYTVVVSSDNVTQDVIIYLLGDVNGDGKINSMDTLRLLRHLAGHNVKISLESADLTGDGKVNSMDTLRLLRHLAGHNVKLGA